MKKSLKTHFLNFTPEWILTPLRKVHYARVLRSISEHSASDFPVFRALVSPGDTVIDLGAHIGSHTKYLADLVGPNGQVFGVEPFPSNFDILSSNVRKLKLDNVRLVNYAVSDAQGRMTMEVPKFTQLGESFYDARLASETPDPSLRRAEVEVNTVDNLFGSLEAISFIKCDVEGQELRTLQGARNVLQKHSPAWLIEISLMDSATHTSIRELMGDLGYEEFWYTGEEMKRWTPESRPIDAFFLQPRHLLLLRNSGLVGSALI